MAKFLACRVCEELNDDQLAELNALMGDPLRWPKTLFADGGMDKPKGMPVRYRTWGAIQMAKLFLIRLGVDISDRTIERHYKADVPVIATDVRTLVAEGIVDKPEERATVGIMNAADAIDPLMFPRYYAQGVSMAARALQILEDRVNNILETDGPDAVPIELLKLMADTGTKLALSGGQITSRGGRIGPKGGHSAARLAAGGKNPSVRIQHQRQHVIDGETVFIADGGPADRAAYNERAAREGLPGLS